MLEYYDWSKIEGYKCPVKIVVGQRGLGKTFGKIKKSIENFLTDGERFIYIVETGDMVKELNRNNGEKFFSSILEYYSAQDTSRKRYFYNKLVSAELKDDEETDAFKRFDCSAKLSGSTIIINNETAGYILDLNSFAEIKRNNFARIKTVIFDEFISEKLDKTTLQSPRKIVSIIQSIARLKDIKIYMLGNSVRTDDPILARMGFKLTKYGMYYKRDEEGLFAVLDYVNPEDYPEFNKAHNKSVAGRLAKMLGEGHEEENKFLSDVPENRRLNTFAYKKNGLHLNLVKDDVIVTLKELKDGKVACVPFAGRNATTLFCMTEKEQGYRLGYRIVCNKSLRQIVMDMLRADIIYYYSDVEYNRLKIIIKGV